MSTWIWTQDALSPLLGLCSLRHLLYLQLLYSNTKPQSQCNLNQSNSLLLWFIKVMPTHLVFRDTNVKCLYKNKLLFESWLFSEGCNKAMTLWLHMHKNKEKSKRNRLGRVWTQTNVLCALLELYSSVDIGQIVWAFEQGERSKGYYLKQQSVFLCGGGLRI